MNCAKATRLVQMKGIDIGGGHRQRDVLISGNSILMQCSFNHPTTDSSSLVSRVNRDLPKMSNP
jgi:hypothetical protein